MAVDLCLFLGRDLPGVSQRFSGPSVGSREALEIVERWVQDLTTEDILQDVGHDARSSQDA